MTGYIPVTADAAIVTAAPTTLGTIRLTGVASGATTVRIVAVNAGGIAAQTLDVTVTDPNALRVIATAPTHCLTGEGTPVTSADGTGRSGIATVDVTYTVTGGTAPYTITNTSTTDAPTTATGTLTISCARDGIDLTNIHPTVNAVESGPKTITLTATDADGDTATTDVTFTVAEDAYTTDYSDGTLTAGNTYALGAADQPILVTLPAGLDLEFEGLSEIGDNGAAHFSDTVSGSEIVLDWGTGAEIYRDVVASSTTRSDTPTPRNVDALFDSLRDSVVEAQDTGGTGTEGGNNYRPYPDLPDTAVVAVHPNMLMGEPILICNRATRDDFGDKKTYDAFKQALSDAIGAWNDALHMAGSATTGTPHKVFETTETCPTFSSVVHVYRDVNSDLCGDDALGCATTYKDGRRPPKIGGGDPRHFRIIVKLADEYHASFKTNLIHELGHFLGLGDYGVELGAIRSECPAEADRSVMTDLVEDREDRDDDGVEELVGYEPHMCGSEGLTDRDKSDVHAIYHPDAVRGPRLKNEGGWRIAGSMPLDAEGGLEYSAYRMVVWQRALGSAAGTAYSYVNAYDMESSELSGAVDISLGSAFDATGWEFLVAGATRGDWKRRTTDGGGSLVKWVAHSDVLSSELGGESWALSESWTLGDPVRLVGPPRAPTGVAASVDGPVVTVSWSAVGGAASYKVYWSTIDFTDPALAQGSVDASGDATSAPVPGLLAGQEYVFRVEATSQKHDSVLAPHTSVLSADARATPGLATPDADGLRASSVTQTSFLAGWDGVLGADSYWVRLDGGTAIEAGLTTAHKFDGLTAGTDYEFEVQAAKGTLRSKWSDPFEVTTAAAAVTPPVTAPAVPVIDTARTVATHNSATVYWTTTDNTAGLSFRVRHRLKPPAGTTVAWTASGVAAQHSDRHLLAGLTAEKTYEVQVRARRGTAGSAWSTTAEVTTTAAPVVVPPVVVPPVVVPPVLAPGSLQVTTTAKAAEFTWAAVAGATGYRVRLGASGDETYKPGASTTSHPFGSLTPDTPYTFYVKTVAGDRSSGWVSTSARTKKLTVDGRAQVRRIPPTSVGGWTLELVFKPTGGDRIPPTLRLTKPGDLETTWQYTSPVEMTVDGRTRELGRVAYRKTTATAVTIELGFRLNNGTVLRPRPNQKAYSAMVVNRWYQTAEFTIELSNTATARAGDGEDVEFAGRLAGGLAPDEEICMTCDAGEADMDGPLEDPPSGDATP